MKKKKRINKDVLREKVMEALQNSESEVANIPCKRVRLALKPQDLGLKKFGDKMFIVYVNAVGYPAADTPCGQDSSYAIAAAADYMLIYKQAIQHIKAFNGCDVPKNFVDYMLRLHLIKYALMTGNITSAVTWWQKLFRNRRNIVNVSDCGCNGNG